MNQSRLLSVIYATAMSFVFSCAQAFPVSGQGTWETTLQGRDLDGNSATFEAYYDTVLDISWLADANAGGALTNWADANAWVAGLNINGITDWRMPTMVDTGPPGCDLSFSGGTDCGYNVQTTSGATVYSELASLFNDTLDNKPFYDNSGNGRQSGWGLSNTGPFRNIVPSDYYWSATEYVTDTDEAWIFHSSFSLQTHGNKNYSAYAWAVHSGDVSATVVPAPAALWLFGSGLIGLLGMARSNKA